MDKVKIYLFTSLSIDFVFIILVLISIHATYFSLGDYQISLAGISTIYEFNLGKANCEVSFADFKDSSCRIVDDSIDIICDLINNLEAAGIVYITFSIVSLISLFLSVLHFILILIVKIKPFPFLNYSHIITTPAYCLGTILYITISTYYSISNTKIGSGIYLIYIISSLALFQISLYVYIKKFKDWNSADIMKYAVIDEQFKAEDGTEMSYTHGDIPKSKDNEFLVRYEELQQKYEEELKLTAALKQEKIQEFRRAKLVEDRKEQEVTQLKGELLRIEKDRNEGRERIKKNEERILKLKKQVSDLENEKREIEAEAEANLMNFHKENEGNSYQVNDQINEDHPDTKAFIQKMKELESEIIARDKEILQLKQFEKTQNDSVEKELEIAKTNIVKLEEKINDIKNENSALKIELENAKEDDKEVERLNMLIEKQHKKKELRIAELEGLLADHGNKLNLEKNRNSELEKEKKIIQQELENVKELKESIEKQMTLIQGKNAEISQESEKYNNEMKELIIKHQTENENLKKSIDELKLEKISADQEILKLSENLAKSQDEINAANKKIESLGLEISRLNTLISNFTTQNSNNEGTITSLTTSVESLENEVSSKSLEIIQLKLSIENKEKEFSSTKLELETCKSNEGTIASLTTSVESLENEVSSKSLEIIQLKLSIENKEKEFSSIQLELETCKSKINELNKSLEETVNEKNEVAKNLMAMMMENQRLMEERE